MKHGIQVPGGFSAKLGELKNMYSTGLAQLCSDDEDDPIYGEYGAVPAKRE